MAIEAAAASSRRALLTGLAAGAAAAAAGTLGRALPVSATHGDVHLGNNNFAETSTFVENTSQGGAALWGKGNGQGFGIFGECGGSGPGVVGESGSTNGVSGISDGALASGVFGSNESDGYGVAGRTGSTLRAGTLGDNTGSGPGVQGESASGTGVCSGSPMGRVPPA